MPINLKFKEGLDKLLREIPFDNKIFKKLKKMEAICDDVIRRFGVIETTRAKEDKEEGRKYMVFAKFLNKELARIMVLDRDSLKLTDRVLILEKRQDPDKFIIPLLNEEILSTKFAWRSEEKIFSALNRCHNYLKSKPRSLEELKVVLRITVHLFAYVLNLVGYTRSIMDKKIRAIARATEPLSGRRAA